MNYYLREFGIKFYYHLLEIPIKNYYIIMFKTIFFYHCMCLAYAVTSDFDKLDESELSRLANEELGEEPTNVRYGLSS